MAGTTYTINFDTGIEKVEYSFSFSEAFSPDGEVTVSGQTVRSSTDLFVRPIFKTGYELDTTNVPLVTGKTDIYTCYKDNLHITNVTFTSKAASTLTFKHFFDSGTVGTGAYKFRHYSQQEPISGETWVLNETVDIPTQSFTVDFVSNGQNFKTIKKVYTQIYYDDVHVYVKNTPDGIHWVSGEVYRTITFSETVTDSTLLAWLQTNGVKQ